MPNAKVDEESYGWVCYSTFTKTNFFLKNIIGDIGLNKNIYSMHPTLTFQAFTPDIISISVDGDNFYTLPMDKSTVLKLFGKPEYIDSYEVPSI